MLGKYSLDVIPHIRRSAPGPGDIVVQERVLNLFLPIVGRQLVDLKGCARNVILILVRAGNLHREWCKSKQKNLAAFFS